jgi:hypothetical protein
MFTRNTAAILILLNFDIKNYGDSNIITSVQNLFKIDASLKRHFVEHKENLITPALI